MGTIHIDSKIEDISKIVVMAGDPLRVKYIAKNFLKETKKINHIRNMLGFTGIYKNKKISIVSHGIGIPSCSIYVKELIVHFGVKKIIRAGSCCALDKNIKIMDIIIGMGACTDSKTNRIKFNDNDFASIADYKLMKNAIEIAKIKKTKIFIGNLFTTDTFYTEQKNFYKILKKYGILGIEMEAAAIYSIAAEHKIQALTICTVSDHIKNNKKITPKQRQKSFKEMIEIALDTIII